MYNVQCLAGHVWDAPQGSELEQRCIKREKEGYLDALCVERDECPVCSSQDRSMHETSLLYDLD